MAVYDSEGELLFDESTMTIFSKIPLSALNMGSMRSLSRFLNIRSQTLVKTGIARGIPPDWTGLAELSSHFDIRDIMNFKEGQHDPTEALVNEWMTKDDATIEKLVTCIKDLERFDLLEELKLHLERDVQNYLKRQEKKYPTPVQDPEVSDSYDESKASDTEMMTIHDEKDNPAMFDAFICAAQEDSPFVRKIIKNLEGSYGLKLCVSARDLLAGDSHTLTAAVIHQRCRRMLIVLSPAFCRSPACDFQVKFAQTLSPGSRTKKLIPVVYKTCQDIPYVLRHISPMDFTRFEHMDWFWDRLGKTLQKPLTWSSEENPSHSVINFDQLDSLSDETKDSSRLCSPEDEQSATSPANTSSSVHPLSPDVLSDAVFSSQKSSEQSVIYERTKYTEQCMEVDDKSTPHRKISGQMTENPLEVNSSSASDKTSKQTSRNHTEVETKMGSAESVGKKEKKGIIKKIFSKR